MNRWLGHVRSLPPGRVARLLELFGTSKRSGRKRETPLVETPFAAAHLFSALPSSFSSACSSVGECAPHSETAKAQNHSPPLQCRPVRLRTDPANRRPFVAPLSRLASGAELALLFKKCPVAPQVNPIPYPCIE